MELGIELGIIFEMEIIALLHLFFDRLQTLNP